LDRYEDQTIGYRIKLIIMYSLGRIKTS